MIELKNPINVNKLEVGDTIIFHHQVWGNTYGFYLRKVMNITPIKKIIKTFEGNTYYNTKDLYVYDDYNKSIVENYYTNIEITNELLNVDFVKLSLDVKIRILDIVKEAKKS